MNVIVKGFLIAVGVVTVTTAATAESNSLTLSAPPREERSVAEKTYAPVAKFLSEQLGQPVVYHFPNSWAEYSDALRKGKYDFVFDGPHFAAWRVVHLQHQPLAKLPGTMTYLLIVSSDNAIYKKIGDLRSGAICGMASPNLATNAILAEFGPVASPKIIVTEGGFDGIMKGFEAGRCDGMILRDSYYKSLPEEKRNKLRVVYSSVPFANQILTAGTRVSEEQLSKLTSALLSEQGGSACRELITRFGDKETKGLVAATAKEIGGNERLLEGVVWGW